MLNNNNDDDFLKSQKLHPTPPPPPKQFEGHSEFSGRQGLPSRRKESWEDFFFKRGALENPKMKVDDESFGGSVHASLSHLHCAPAGAWQSHDRKQPWPREEEVRVTGSTVLRGLCGRGDERQICRCKKGKPHGEMGNARLRDIFGHWKLWLWPSGPRLAMGISGEGTVVRRLVCDLRNRTSLPFIAS